MTLNRSEHEAIMPLHPAQSDDFVASEQQCCVIEIQRFCSYAFFVSAKMYAEKVPDERAKLVARDTTLLHERYLMYANFIQNWATKF